MLLKKLLQKQIVKKVISDIELYFVKLSWKELTEFQKFAETNEKLNDDESAFNLTKYILERYVKDENGADVIEVSDIEDLPVSFCVELIHEFLKFTRGDSEEETKKN